MISSDQAMQELIEGNCRFAQGCGEGVALDAAASSTAGPALHPLAIILYCADLEIQPTEIFDQCPENLATISAKANMARGETIQAIWDALLQHGCKLVVVLGHHPCKTVEASVQAGWATGELGNAVARARLCVRDAGEQAVLHATLSNIRASVAQLRASKAALVEAAPHNDILIAGAIYNPGSGRVEFIS